MVDTNQRTDNEEWLFNALAELEEMNLLGDFCRHAGLNIAGGGAMVETLWPAVRAHYRLADGNFDVSAACQDMLAFPPMVDMTRRMIRPSGRDGKGPGEAG